MKQKDLALIIVIVAVSGVVSYFVSHLIFVTSKSSKQQVEVVSPISTDFPTPDNKYFNNQSIDPTQQIKIGNNNNPDPFHGQ